MSYERLPPADVSPFDGASVVSRVCHIWLSPLLAKGRRAPLAVDDVMRHPSVLDVSDIADCALKQYDTSGSVQRTCVALVWREVLSSALFAGGFALLRSLTPVLLRGVIGAVSDPTMRVWPLAVLLSLFSLSSVFTTVLQQQWWFLNEIARIRVVAALRNLVLRKTLTLGQANKGVFHTIANTDPQRIGDTVW